MGIMFICRNKSNSETRVFCNVDTEKLSKKDLILGVLVEQKETKRIIMSDHEKIKFLDMVIDGVLNRVEGEREYFLR